MSTIASTISQCLVVVAIVMKGQADDPIVNTTHGQVIGLRKVILNKTINSFYGIPFAKPPVGSLRFKKPETLPAWGEQIMDARIPKNSCLQWHESTPYWLRSDGLTRSEDCLYLNIWAPANSTESLTTLVWLHGGAFISNSINRPLCQGHYLAVVNNVIVASINYRLGAFGFFYTGSDSAPGNQGMLDQVLGLRWIHDNIHRFGGDPKRITLFGESAGAASVNHHLLSPLSRDLFQFAILQSGTAEAKWALLDTSSLKGTSIGLATLLGCPTVEEVPMMECMLKTDPQSIVDNQLSSMSKFNPIPWAPIVDGHFLPYHPEQMLLKGDVKNTSVIIGVTKNEGAFNFSGQFNKTQFTGVAYLAAFPYADKSIYPAVVNEYAESTVPSLRPSYYALTEDLLSDLAFMCPAASFAMSYSAIGNKVFMYSLEHRSALCPFPEHMGVAHTCDLELVFGHPLNDSLAFTNDDKRISQHIMHYWTSFAKTGDPNNAQTQSTWPMYDNQEMKYIVLNKTISTGQGLRYRKCMFWQKTVKLLTKIKATNDSKPCNTSDTSHAEQTKGKTAVLSLMFGLLFAVKSAFRP
ncbi:acetylcholinesterase-like [Gigantopelta aegis]|uniref:acetylcholinesterase-like n=1 Tax=Gigantopelta aegis TaxID=1735272 RepID=UPI001B88B4F9|nr:acetylcholinesterase-like [Gigantopelta aegis]XP_041378203.1 acetylcholinesterase-like [Gigantopelta aegis]